MAIIVHSISKPLSVIEATGHKRYAITWYLKRPCPKAWPSYLMLGNGQIREMQMKFTAPHPLNLVAPHLMIDLRQAGYIAAGLERAGGGVVLACRLGMCVCVYIYVYMYTCMY